MEKRASLSVMLAGTLWGFISIFLNPMLEYGISSTQIAVMRFFFCALILLILLLIKSPKQLKIRLRDIWIFLGTGILNMALFSIFYFTSISLNGASVAVVLLYTSPIFVIIFSVILFKEKITKQKIIALCLTLAGCVLVSGVIGGTQTMSITAIAIGVGAGFCYSLYSIFGPIALKRNYSTTTISFYTFVFAFIGTLPFCKPLEMVEVVVENPILILYTCLIGTFCTLLPSMLYTYGLKYVQPGRAAILATLEPLVGALVGILVFKESSEPVKLIGMFLILLSIIVLNVNWGKKDEAPNIERQ